MKQSFNWKTIIPYCAALVLFISFALFYCSPVLNGKVLMAGDVTSWQGMSQEAREYYQQTGKTTWWTNSMFGGMPTFQITGATPTNQLRERLENIFRLGFHRENPIGILIAYFLGFFFMLRCFRVNPWLSIVGALAIGLSSYFLLIIPAGHMTKAAGLAMLAPVIGGFYAVFRKDYWLGAPLIVIYGIIGITLHPQMTYYICMLLGILAIAELYIHIREQRWKDLGVAVGILLVCLALIMGTKLSWLQMNNEYLAETMRGGHSELTTNNKDDDNNSGLNFKYATDWSYGKAETLTLLIPNYMGGASGYNVGEKSVLYKELTTAGVPKSSAKRFCQQAPTYWGEKAFTSGPVYVGAIICFLFILGLIIVPGAYKWALLAATLFSVFLAWGRNFLPLTEFFFQHFPMYNKFRTVESILVVAEITIPLLGFLGLRQILNSDERKYSKQILIAGGITAFLCLCVAVFGANNPVSSYDAAWKGQVGNDIYQMILDQRTAMAHADAWRSLIFVLLGTAIVWLYSQRKMKMQFLYIGLGLLVLVDMIPVNRRFFNTDNFVNKKESINYFAMQPWEEQILKDNTLDYRVLNLTANTFNDARTSYRLKSVGGYHAAKLRRYQDLIEAHISRNNHQVLNMLNTKYIITREGVYTNQEAFGNAWFVDKVNFVETPDAECEALNTLDLRHEAVADKQFEPILNTRTDAEATIELTHYAPNRLEYITSVESDRVCVFSEIYYPHGWHLYMMNTDENNKKEKIEIPVGRADYTLRAAVIPAGTHKLVMEFVPDALKTDKWCMTILIISILLSLGALWLHFCGKGPICCPSAADKE